MSSMDYMDEIPFEPDKDNNAEEQESLPEGPQTPTADIVDKLLRLRTENSILSIQPNLNIPEKLGGEELLPVEEDLIEGLGCSNSFLSQQKAIVDVCRLPLEALPASIQALPDNIRDAFITYWADRIYLSMAYYPDSLEKGLLYFKRVTRQDPTLSTEYAGMPGCVIDDTLPQYDFQYRTVEKIDDPKRAAFFVPVNLLANEEIRQERYASQGTAIEAYHRFQQKVKET